MDTTKQLIKSMDNNDLQKTIQIINKLSDDDLIVKFNNGQTVLHDAVGHGWNCVVDVLMDRLSDEDLIIKDNAWFRQGCFVPPKNANIIRLI